MAAVTSVGQQQLGKDEFLRLFTTQAQMQNPMNPMEGTDFLAQLAQFTSVEQMSNLNTNFEKLLSVQQTLQAGSMVGKVVSYTDTTTGESDEGRVTAVKLTAAGPILMLGNREVPLSAVTSIKEPEAQPATAAADRSDKAVASL